MNYQLIAFDMDGTFLDSNKKVPLENRKAVQKAVEQGKIVIISSGRGLAELKDILEVVPQFRYILMTSGAMVYDIQEKKVIYDNQLSVEHIRAILEVAKKKDTLVQILSNESIVEEEKGHRLKDYQMGVYQPMYNEVCTFVDHIYTYYESNPVPVQKINLYHLTEEERDDTFELLKSLPISIKKSEKTSVECSALGINKGTGLKKLCEYLGIDIKDTIAVGDGENDLEILEVAGLSIAMDNATDHIKEISEVVVSDNDHGGCVEAIEQYLLMKG